MTTTEALLAIPIMFYVCLAVLPILIIFLLGDIKAKTNIAVSKDKSNSSVKTNSVKGKTLPAKL